MNNRITKNRILRNQITNSQTLNNGVTKATVLNSFLHSLHTTWELLRVIVPAFIVMTLLKHTFVFNFIADKTQPLMQLFGLPGQAAIPITMGVFFNQYLAVGALSAMDLTVKEITISALILCICHELLVESVVVKKTGTAIWAFVLARFVFAFLGAFTLNALWSAL